MNAPAAASFTFTATATIKSLYAIKKKKLVSLAPQEFIDCGSQSSCSSYITNAYYYALNYGVNYERTYPYKGMQQPCKDAAVSRSSRWLWEEVRENVTPRTLHATGISAFCPYWGVLVGNP